MKTDVILTDLENKYYNKLSKMENEFEYENKYTNIQYDENKNQVILQLNPIKVIVDFNENKIDSQYNIAQVDKITTDMENIKTKLFKFGEEILDSHAKYFKDYETKEYCLKLKDKNLYLVFFKPLQRFELLKFEDIDEKYYDYKFTIPSIEYMSKDTYWDGFNTTIIAQLIDFDYFELVE
ncbi:hypothetical protein [Miniphocaeibacter halophilus]|uniref:Uncharacterized protein n=1 Tax=Miniphocaeibacter halophilus TaxID=2931922 RepID=A0AC61MYV2_9FIRM|nr:hypothetical protein [Miniphocaeibacter halophilus]QQK08745.1 hypothetical protein JFY71_04180 [Miniphocaeibacter halophilus]